MEEAITKQDIVERRIKSDIVRKNTLRSQLSRDINKVVRWVESLDTVKNNRKRKKYVRNLERIVPQITKTKKLVLELIDDLQTRIKDELKYPENEISALQQTAKNEYEKMADARKKLIKAKKSGLGEKEMEELVGKTIEGMVILKGETPDSGKQTFVIPKEVLLVKVQKSLRKEVKDADKAENTDKELKSEEKDKILFQNEMKRMVLEKEILL